MSDTSVHRARYTVTPHFDEWVEFCFRGGLGGCFNVVSPAPVPPGCTFIVVPREVFPHVIPGCLPRYRTGCGLHMQIGGVLFV